MGNNASDDVQNESAVFTASVTTGTGESGGGGGGGGVRGRLVAGERQHKSPAEQSCDPAASFGKTA